MRVNYVQCTTRGSIQIGRLGRVIEAAWEAKKARTDRFIPWRDDDDDWDSDDADALDSAAAWGAGWAEDALKYTLCCNAPVQGACADAGMLALIKIDAALCAARIDGGIVLFVHDEIVLEVAAHQAEQAREILAACMTEAFAETFPGAPLTLCPPASAPPGAGRNHERPCAAGAVEGRALDRVSGVRGRRTGGPTTRAVRVRRCRHRGARDAGALSGARRNCR
jgi:hypothetical protein